MYDVLIVGGGPAGLSAALILGRCRRSVLVCDSDTPRNGRARHMHGYLTRDGTPPQRFLQLGRRDLLPYDVRFFDGIIHEATCLDDGTFRVIASSGAIFRGRKLLLATGVRDDVPDIPGLDALYGKSVHHCPYCDAWEWRDRAIAVYGTGKSAVSLALKLHNWSADIVVCSGGPSEIEPGHREQLRSFEIDVIEKPIAHLDGAHGHLKRIVFDDGTFIARDALFFHAPQPQQAGLAKMLGCRVDTKRGVHTDDRERTGVPGLFLAGDASRDVQFVIVAAAEGATAATAINAELLREEGRWPVEASALRHEGNSRSAKARASVFRMGTLRLTLVL